MILHTIVSLVSLYVIYYLLRHEGLILQLVTQDADNKKSEEFVLLGANCIESMILDDSIDTSIYVS